MYQDPYDEDAGYEDPYRARRNHYTGPPEISEKEQMEGGQGKGSGKKKTKKAEAVGEAEDGGKKMKEKKEKSQREEGERQSEAENDDPFVLLARKMGKAGRHIWKKVASGGKNGKEGAAGEKEQQAVVLAAVTADPGEGQQKEKERQERREGGVWTEEVGEQYRKMQEQRVKDSMEPDALALHVTSSSPPPPESRNFDQRPLPEEVASPTVETDREGEKDQIQEKDPDVKGVKSDGKTNASLTMSPTPILAS